MSKSFLVPVIKPYFDKETNIHLCHISYICQPMITIIEDQVTSFATCKEILCNVCINTELLAKNPCCTNNFYIIRMSHTET